MHIYVERAGEHVDGGGERDTDTERYESTGTPSGRQTDRQSCLSPSICAYTCIASACLYMCVCIPTRGHAR